MIVLAVLVLVFAPVYSQEEDQSAKVCLGHVCLPKNYSKLQPPVTGEHDEPVNISVGIFVLDITKVDTKMSSIEMILQMSVIWKENRLTYSETSDKTWENMDVSLLKYIWVPDVYIYNLRDLTIPSLYGPFGGLWVSNETYVWMSNELHLKLSCPMKFDLYPMDFQVLYVSYSLFLDCLLLTAIL